jgi:SWI/SNF-related matrix-associated actin-dependent regulator of chromatin subfamily A3
VSPIESGELGGFNNLRTLLKSVCLRRTRDILLFPEQEEIIYELELSPIEKEMYHSISESSKQAIDDVVSGRKTMEAYNGILQAIMQLRLLCNHGTFDHMVRKSGVMGSLDLDETLASLQQTDDAICTICSCDVTSVNNPEGLMEYCRPLPKTEVNHTSIPIYSTPDRQQSYPNYWKMSVDSDILLKGSFKISPKN